MSQQFDSIKKVIDGIDRRFIEESADSMLSKGTYVVKSPDVEASELIEIKECPKKRSFGMLAGLSAAAAALVCVVSVGVIAAGGGNGITVQQSSSDSDMMESVIISTSTPTVQLPGIDTMTVPKGSYAEENNKRINYTREEVSGIIGRTDNFTVAEDFICDVPKEIESIKEFTLMYSSRQENEDFYNDFLAMFRHIYPDEPFYEDCVFWYKETWDEEGEYHREILPLAETAEDFLNSGNSAKLIFYSTNEKEEAERNIFLEIASPVCNDLFNLNRGVLAEYRNISKYTFLETVFPRDYYKVATHPADSDAKYTLFDGKEMSVKDAVKFYEDYVNTLPMSHTASTNVRVKEVDVLKYGENAYCYLFINTVSYDGINLSYLRMSEDCTSSSQSCNKFIWSMGSMVVTDEVDHIYGIPRSFIMTEETESSEIISFETAVDIISNAMIADYVVTGAELLYLPDMPADQRVRIEDYKCRTSAKWKLTLYNESDGLYYHCYINAKDGKGFEYFKTE